MGQTTSVHKQTRKRSLRSPFLRRSTSQKAPLSHTFSFVDEDHKTDQLNINFATEEELMTLPGINREIAKNVVEHRKVIGRFRKVEDLALVPGIGADKFENIRLEVCVKLNSCNSSRAQSYDSLRSVDSRLTPRLSKRVIDINKASVFELQCVHGMTQEMAANILHYRNKKGPFKQVEDLVKVRGIDHVRLGNMRHLLAIDSVTRSTSEVLTNSSCNGALPTNRHRKSSSAPIKFAISNGLLHSSVSDIFELLSAYSPRPIFTEDFNRSRKGQLAVRIATWNLHQFCVEKAQNLGVKEVVCRTILENGWSIICLQDIEDKQAVQILCDELNCPKLRRVSEWKLNGKDWHYCMVNSQQGFLYDRYCDGIGVELKAVKEILVEDYKYTLVQFKVETLDLYILNVQLPEDFPLEHVDVKLKEFINEDDCFILLGDFTSLINDSNNSLKNIGGLEAILPLNTNTTYLNLKFKYSDNIFVNPGSKSLLTGMWGIVRQGLTHLAIPNGWSWGGPVSPHCPLWTELYVKVKGDAEL